MGEGRSLCLWSRNYHFFGVAPREKIVTFEKINSFKRGGVRTWLIGLATIITGVRCLGAQVGGLFFQK